ncbi:MAG: DNA/RNA non-specific endonuclease [Actinobacteria bacterium]|nr:DNA/RNA non-specific endonuclease [Actinomycetota bacterium]
MSIRAETAAGRRRARALAGAAVLLLLVLGTVVATAVADSIGLSLTTSLDASWLAGLFDDLAQWWDAQPWYAKLAIGAGIAALVVLSGGTFGAALAVSGGATTLAAYGRGTADFIRDPRAATTDFVTTLTPQQAGAYGLELVAGRLIPAGIGAVAGRGVRRNLDEYAADPAAWRATRRDALRGETGAFTVGVGPPPAAVYGPLDSLGRATSVRATLDASHLNTGTRATATGVPGVVPGSKLDRGHLLSKLLGGLGNDRRNLTAMLDNINRGQFRKLEKQIAHALDRGEVLDFRAVPTYRGNNSVPLGVTVDVTSRNGTFVRHVTVLMR